MATKTVTTATNDGTGRKLAEQPRRFIGLYVAPLAALPMAWLIHLWAFGLALGPIDFHPNPSLQTGTLLLLGAAVLGLTLYAHALAGHRDGPVRWAFTITVATLGVLFGWNVGTGPQYVVSGAFLILSWVAATAWVFPRLNVARKDAKGDGEEKEGVWERMGLKRHFPRIRKQHFDKDGNLERTEIDVDHPGETTDPLHAAVRSMESLVGAPAGLSHAVGVEGRADKSTIVLQHKDALKGRIPYGPPSHPGGSIADPIIFALYKDGQPVRIYLGGGPVSINPTGYIYMGASRSGKTLGENEMLTDVISRRDVVILYLNRAKGRQDIRPVAPGIAAAVLSDSDADYRSAFKRLRKLMDYRQKTLAAYGISAWAPLCYFNPPQRKANGEAVPMEPMPALMVHVGEADDVLEAADDDVIYVASKGLSLGVISGYSLQRALTDSMPSALKENLGLRLCFGTGNWNAASFVMDDVTLKSVDPSQWGQKYPGRHLVQGPGIEESRQPVYAKTMSLAPGMDEDASVEEHNAAMSAEMLRRNYENAPRMAKLDRGSALATGMVGPMSWWDLMIVETAKVRAELGVGTAEDTATLAANPTATSAAPTANMTASDRRFATANPEPYPTANQEDSVRFQPTAIPDDADDTETAEVRAEIDDLEEYDGLKLFPPDEDGETAEHVNLDDPLPRAPQGQDLSWEDPLPAPASRGEAIAAVKAVLVQLLDKPELADPDGNGAIVQVGDVRAPYPFKSRPWFSETLSAMASGDIDLTQDGLSLTVAEEFPSHNRRFRLQRVITGE